jgi:ectoine hydroxylase-related dioxygenase (phytanoyl-CoA dioxygenase family)
MLKNNRRGEFDYTILTHAVRERNVTRDIVDECHESLTIKGFFVAKSDLTQVEIDYARTRADEIYELQVKDVGGVVNLKKINDENIARAVCAWDNIFLRIATLPIIMRVCHRMLGPYITLMSQNAILNHPGTDHYQFTYHRDLNYQHWTSSRPLSISALVCLDPFDEKTGGTYVLPASHKLEPFPSDEYVRANQEVIYADPGDVIFFDSMLYHRTGKNTSEMVRRAINHIITPPFIRQQYNFPKMLKNHGVSDPAIRKYLGFEMELPDDALAWRLSKLRGAGVEL